MTPAVERWLPINFLLSPIAVSVTWVDFGSKQMSEPFFLQTIKNLKSGESPAKRRTTELGPLLEMANGLPPVRPSGLIFHVTRCGSTLLAKALGTGDRVVTLYEARPIAQFLRPNVFLGSPFPQEGWDEARRTILNAVAAIYAHSFGVRDPRLIIKCHAIDLLEIRHIRSVWPDTPSVVVIRDPVEVMVSNFAKPAPWVTFKNYPHMAHKVFGWPEDDARKMSMEEHCARGMGRFFESAADAIDAKCKVIDYSNIEISNIMKVADFLNIKMPSPESNELRTLMATWSKDPNRERPFVNDRERKQLAATPEARQAASCWAQKQYESLKAMESW